MEVMQIETFFSLYHTAIHLLPLPWLSLCGSGNVLVVTWAGGMRDTTEAQ